MRVDSCGVLVERGYYSLDRRARRTMSEPTRTAAPPTTEIPTTVEPSMASRQVTRLRVRKAQVLRGTVFFELLRNDFGTKRGRDVGKNGSFSEG